MRSFTRLAEIRQKDKINERVNSLKNQLKVMQGISSFIF
ncbi:hypothetical protein RV10_GL003320 [Enterococcus pallens]|nr:hypothetical protein RV10_GL003320 [Enterococcus pallens]